LKNHLNKKNSITKRNLSGNKISEKKHQGTYPQKDMFLFFAMPTRHSFFIDYLSDIKIFCNFAGE